VHRRFTPGRWTFELWTGKHRRARAQIARGVVVDQHAAELAARLTAGLNTRVLLYPRSNGTALSLLDADGQPLRNHGGERRVGKNGQELEAVWPIPVAIIPNDPALWYAPDLPVTVFLEPVPGTSVGMAGNRGDTVEDAATHIIRHYRPALDPTAEPWEWDTPWREAEASRTAPDE
jgi:hypothetical protein